MIKVFVIEYFRISDENSFDQESFKRKGFWDTLIEKYKNSAKLRIELCDQIYENDTYLRKNGKPFSIEEYDLIFIHASDRMFDNADDDDDFLPDYVNLAKEKAYVLYTGGIEEHSEKKFDLEKFQLEQISRIELYKRAEDFFDEIEREGKLTEKAFQYLTKYPRRQYSLRFLMVFLPLHFSLQIDDIQKSRDLACDLIRQKTTISNHFNKVVSLMTEQDLKDNSQNYKAIALQEGLIELVEEISKPENKKTINVFQKEFHEIFLDLRNILLVENNSI